MRILLLAATALLILTANLAGADDLKRIDLDDPSSLGMQIAADTKVKVEGKSSTKITTCWPTSVCLGVVSDLDVENAKLIYRAKVKSDLKEGNAFLEMWALLAGGNYFSRGLNSTISGNTDWKTIETPFIFQKGQKPEKVTLNLVINGKGTVWIDAVTLSKEP